MFTIKERDGRGKAHGGILLGPLFFTDAEVPRFNICTLDVDSDIQHDFQTGGTCLLFSVCSTELGLYGKFLKISKYYTSVVPCSSGNFFFFQRSLPVKNEKLFAPQPFIWTFSVTVPVMLRLEIVKSGRGIERMYSVHLYTHSKAQSKAPV